MIVVSMLFGRKKRSGRAVYTKELCLELHKSEGRAHILASNNPHFSHLAGSNRED